MRHAPRNFRINEIDSSNPYSKLNSGIVPRNQRLRGIGAWVSPYVNVNGNAKNTRSFAPSSFLFFLSFFPSRSPPFSFFVFFFSPSSRFHLQLAFGQWVAFFGTKNRGNGRFGGCAIPLTLSLSLSLAGYAKSEQQTRERRVIKSAFQHLIIARRNLISNPFCAALFSPAANVLVFRPVESAASAERTWDGGKDWKKGSALLTRLIIFSPLPSFSLRFNASDRCSFIDWPGSSFENRVREKSRLPDIRYSRCFHRVKNHRCGIQPFRDFSLYFFSSFFFFANYIRYIFYYFFFFYTALSRCHCTWIPREYPRDFPARPGTVINLRSLRERPPLSRWKT